MIATFHQCDVFTDRLFGGNPLAVVPDADGLDSATMQAFAREMNCSESAFVFHPRDPRAACRVRIFTPGRELPFAGHPTIGTAYTLHRLGLLDARSFSFEMEAGLIPVRREGSRFWLTPPVPTLGDALGEPAALARALGIDAAAVSEGARIVGSFLCVRVWSLEALANVDPDRAALRGILERRIADGNLLLFFFDSGRAWVRMFADIAEGIGEDPATGSAVAPMLHALAASGALALQMQGVEIEQGRWIDRRSTLYARLSWAGSDISSIEVGGDCVHAFSSEIAL
ncbi:MAG: PhzF family phenazine biosynthesis protein [Candidatus Eremiobacteraeota bacterium]|nr:PhzF family phenazine biosynthesis protein [Candidatus Eremiobacteraeota bacterium]